MESPSLLGGSWRRLGVCTACGVVGGDLHEGEKRSGSISAFIFKPPLLCMRSQVSFGRQRRPVVPFHLALPTPTHLILQALVQPQRLRLPPRSSRDTPVAACKEEQPKEGPQGASSAPAPPADGPPSPEGGVPLSTRLRGPPTCGKAPSNGALKSDCGTVRLVDYIVTQNVDALHERCGAPFRRVADVHGLCNFPPCGVCTDVLLDWFDAYEPHFLTSSLVYSRQSPSHLCLGTSLQIQPACHFPAKERRKNSVISIVNLQATPLDEDAQVCLHAPVDAVLKEAAKGLGLQPGWGWGASARCSMDCTEEGAHSVSGGRWGAMGCCDPRGFEKDPVPFHYGEFTRTSLVFVIRLPTNALPPQLHLNHEVLQQSDIVENQQARQQALEASGAWEESLSWLFPGGISAGGLLAAGGAVEKTASPEGALETLPDQEKGGPLQIFLVAAACGTALEFHRGHSSGSGGTAAAAPPSAIECFDSLRGLWKVAIDKDCSLQLSLWYGTTAALHLTYDSNACVSCMPSASVSLEPPYEPRWPEGRSVRRCRLIGVLSARPCGCLSADDAAANGDADREAPEEPHACETREFPLPDSLVSLYRLHAAAALPPKEPLTGVLHPPLLNSISGKKPSPAQGLQKVVSASPQGAPAESASGGFELENMSRSSSVERRYPLRRSRQMGSGAASPSALKRRRGNGSGGPQRGAPRGPGAAVASSVPTVRLPTEQEEAALPYLPLQLTLRPQDQEQRQHASTALQLDNAQQQQLLRGPRAAACR
ncbi:sir2 domain-containing protein [Cyclospora cayetanensis]|uniref:protein acetyllysine N-acetyltransferase n=1 Tax=Cyclospora cayetanensis TaxID=88456 RepID=A0A1D3D893_9EIME|nr:sir2 domain-containing protein [Cyclospora cayetanensis]